MLMVTEDAKEELQKLLSANVDNPQAGLRLIPSYPDEWTLSIDIEMPGDQVVEHEGSKVLLVESALAAGLEGATLDVQDTAEGRKLVVYRE